MEYDDFIFYLFMNICNFLGLWFGWDYVYRNCGPYFSGLFQFDGNDFSRTKPDHNLFDSFCAANSFSSSFCDENQCSKMFY